MQNDFISFFDARAFLTKKFGKMPSYAEFWMWCFFGKGGGGIDAYYQSGKDCPNKKYVKHRMLNSQLVMFKDIEVVAKGIKQFWFLHSEIESFKPIDRFITADELIKKWTAKLASEEKAKDYINTFAREAADWEDNNSILRNQYCGAYSSTTKAFEPLNGVYSVKDILAVENHCHMTEPQAETLGDDGTKKKERELTIWMRETWLTENNPGGSAFFNALKKYVGKDGSPIVEHYTAGKNGAGIRWNTGNATNSMTKKAIQSKVSLFKKTQ